MQEERPECLCRAEVNLLPSEQIPRLFSIGPSKSFLPGKGILGGWREGTCLGIVQGYEEYSIKSHIYMNKSLPWRETSRMLREKRGSGGGLTLFKWLVLAASLRGITLQLHLPSGVLGSETVFQGELKWRSEPGLMKGAEQLCACE